MKRQIVPPWVHFGLALGSTLVADWYSRRQGRGAGTIRALMSHIEGNAQRMDFENLVTQFYRSLFQFAFSLTQSESDACDLTQQTFYVWATKGHQLRDQTKVKTWLFTTLHRAFLESRRRQVRFPHFELDEVPLDLPTLSPATVNQLDSPQVIHALAQVDEIY